MNKLNNFKWFLLGVVVCLIMSVLVVPALASSGTKDATLYYRDIKITLDGNTIIPKDASGNAVEPFIIDGTTYLPVRGIAPALGLSVDWDAANSIVKLTTPSSPTPSPSPSAPSSPSPSPSPSPAGNSIKLVSITSPVSRSSMATVSVIGKPNTQYTISVYYTTTVSSASGLDPKMSNASGVVSWSWIIGSQTTQTSHYLVISGGGDSLQVNFTVQ